MKPKTLLLIFEDGSLAQTSVPLTELDKLSISDGILEAIMLRNGRFVSVTETGEESEIPESHIVVHGTEQFHDAPR